MARYSFLEGYEIEGCAVRRRNILSLFGTQWAGRDAYEVRPTGIFFYYPDRPVQNRWAGAHIGDTSGIHGTAVFAPEERMLFVMEDGAVYVVGQGDNSPEQPVTNDISLFRQVRTIDGFGYAVGAFRSVFRREAKDTWVQLSQGLPPDVPDSGSGFADIDGFSSSEIYACGGEGDLWTYDGAAWSQLDLPTNVKLRKICCGEDNLVYILTAGSSIIVGRGSSWHILEQDVAGAMLEELVWFQDRIHVSTEKALLEIANGRFAPSRLTPPPQDTYTHLAARDGVLLVAGMDAACMYDGSTWSVILEPP